MTYKDTGEYDKQALEDAMLLIASVRAALKNKVKHYHAGRLLASEEEIIAVMGEGHTIEVDERERVVVSSVHEELFKIKTAHELPRN